MQTLGYPVLAVLSSCLIVYAVDPLARATRLTRFFGTRLMRVLGKYSYAIYIFHFPLAGVLERLGLTVQTFPRIAGSELPGMIAFTLIACAISLGLALLSWNLYEKHFLRLKRFFPRREDRITNLPDPQVFAGLARNSPLSAPPVEP
jgi:peptidoglycan/LPS O-acetylase OafA/YrhL